MSGEVQRISGEQGEVRTKFFYQIKTSELKQTRGRRRLDYWVNLEAASNSYISTIRRQAISVSQVEYNNHWERWLQIFTKDCHDIWKHENQPTFAWHLSVGLGSIFFGTFIFSVKSTTIRRGPRGGPAAGVEYCQAAKCLPKYHQREPASWLLRAKKYIEQV